jgi:CheY-like chemotaxis protein
VPQTLLLADDSVTIQRVIELTFADEDIQVVAVSDGDQAIAVLERQPPDIVLADIGMPGKSGYEVAQHIRNHPGLAHIPVVLLTGAFEPVDQARAAAAGCSGVLAKPFEPQQVIGRVRELLAQKGRPAEAPAPAPPLPPPPAAPFMDAEPETVSVNSGPATGDYFEQFDSALTGLNAPAQRSAPEPDLDWFSPRSSDAPPAAPNAPPPVAFEADRPSSGRPTAVAPPQVTGLADAFAALLASEQASPQSAAPRWTAPAAPPPAVSDDLVEQVAARVLERLSDRAVRETVADIVSEVAERLVRDEIARIKASIK